MFDKLKIAHIYASDCGRNDGAPLYTLEALKKCDDVSVDHYLPRGNSSLWGKYDLYWWVDFADDALGYGDFPCPKPNFYWCSDYHISQDSYNYRLKRAAQFDWIGCYQLRNVEEFVKDGIDPMKIFWLPPAFEPNCYRPGTFDFEKGQWIDAEVMKKYDISFVGHINNQKRMEALDKLFKNIPNFFYGTKIFEKCAMIYNQSKVVFNISHLDDANMRLAESMGTGSFLLTENIPSIHDLYEDGVHLVTYNNMDDAIEKAKYYIEHDEEREKIAKAGYELALSRDTYAHRVNQVLNIVKNGKKDGFDLFPINKLVSV